MLIVSKSGEVQLTRGDTARLTVDITDDAGQVYFVQQDDVLTLTVKKSYEDTEPCFQKIVTGGNTFHIEPTDTKGLEFGKYKYDVQLDTASGDSYTVVADKVFTVLKEVT